MSGVLKDLFGQARKRHLEFRRLDSCFHAYSGALIEALRERNYRLNNFDTDHGMLTLAFEQPDGDQFLIRVEPYRTSHPFLRSIGPVVELVFTLVQHIEDPNVIAAAQAGMMRQGVGRMLGVSRSRLYRLFEPLGGVTAYIRRQRLLAAHRALLDPLETSAIVAISERVGFPDASAFSRAFRAEFGYSPSHARAALSRRTAAPSVRRPGMGSSGLSLGDILNRLSA